MAIPLLVWGTTWALPTFTAIITPFVYGTCAAVVAVGSYYVYDKIIDVYAPDGDIPRKDGEPIPDEAAEGDEHTRLGTHTSKRGKGKYLKAIEFDNQGKPVREIEFTDHCRKDHACPHQHPYVENGTGGTRQRGDHEPLTKKEK